MYMKYIFFCYFLLQSNCNGCPAKVKNFLCQLLQNAHENIENSLKLTRNLLQVDDLKSETYPDIIQDKSGYYKHPHDSKNIRNSLLSIFQTNDSEQGVSDGIQYLKYVFESPEPQNGKFDKNIKKKTVNNKIPFQTSAYSKNVRIPESPMSQNYFKRDGEKTTEYYTVHYDTNSKEYKLSDSPKALNGNFRKDFSKESLGSATEFETSTYPDSWKNSQSLFLHNNFNQNREKTTTEGNIIQYDADINSKYTKTSKSPTIRNNNFKRQMKKGVSDTIHLHNGRYPSDINVTKTFKLSVFHDNINEEKPATNDNANYETNSNAKNIISTSLLLENNDNKLGRKGESSKNNTIYFDTGRQPEVFKATKSPVLQDNGSARAKREGDMHSRIIYDKSKTPQLDKGIKILEQEPGETHCNYHQCVEICNTIYLAIPIHLAQCYNNDCFCFPKKDLYPPVIKNIMKNHQLFGIHQTYE